MNQTPMNQTPRFSVPCAASAAWLDALLPDNRSLLAQPIDALLRQKLDTGLLDRALAILHLNSYAEGLANAYSDIDVMVLLEAPVEGHGAEFWLPIVLPGARLDVYFVTADLIRTRLQEAARFDLARIMFLHKIKTARVVQGEAAWARVLDAHDWSGFQDKLVGWHADNLATLLEDAIGNLSDGDPLSSALNARLLVERAIDGYRASLGDSQPRPKWRSKKMRALGCELDSYLATLFSAAPDSVEDGARFLGQCARHAQHLQLLAYFPGLRIGAPSPFGQGVYVPPCAVLSRQGERFIVHAPRPVLAISRESALVWLLAPLCASLDELIAMLGSAIDNPPGPVRIAELLERLVRDQLLRVSP
ncbi:hypothetical protein BN2497_6205 [Janthinobacterium sp. CG23_2]|nr:hypothetical protein BN2497_6205 [Janthinobacterium sp. CG23_2]CUU29500.1 hypothetical protein BN3177_6205 [Janthinobacterium sp. CG23_2]